MAASFVLIPLNENKRCSIAISPKDSIPKLSEQITMNPRNITSKQCCKESKFISQVKRVSIAS